MATKYQAELALKALITEMNEQGMDIHSLVDSAIARMHTKHMYVKEDSHREKGGAEDALHTVVKSLVVKYSPPRAKTDGAKPLGIEDF
ncbi:hypothetical protein [Pectobacterium parmentieri]|uniref:Uncharacterized protein n=1 Tax=Pectobacterium parmentieri TaxID=1905730 RepID=A0A8B3FCL1_PECPM|nr:hypothetical protein [Pectobacterium parmentieri]RKO77177.1 hypothetical protein C5E00_10460 [Pectobacterium parmentieri]